MFLSVIINAVNKALLLMRYWCVTNMLLLTAASSCSPWSLLLDRLMSRSEKFEKSA